MPLRGVTTRGFQEACLRTAPLALLALTACVGGPSAPSSSSRTRPWSSTGRPAGCEEVVVNELVRQTWLTPLDWVELHNPAATVADLGGCHLVDDLDHVFTLPGGTLLPAGGWLVLGQRGVEAIGVEVPEALQYDFGFGDADLLALFDPLGGEVDTLTWADGALGPEEPWGRSPDGVGDLVLLPRGTPGAANLAPCSGDPLPTPAGLVLGAPTLAGGAYDGRATAVTADVDAVGELGLVAWNDNGAVRATRMTSDGVQLDAPPLSLGSGTLGGRVHVSASADRFLVSWDELAVRIEPDGRVLDPGGLTFAPHVGVDGHLTISDGADFLILYDAVSEVSAVRLGDVLSAPTTTGLPLPPADLAPAGAGWITTYKQADPWVGGYDVWVDTLDAQGVASGSPILVGAGPNNDSAVGITADGDGWLVVWAEDGTGRGYATLVDARGARPSVPLAPGGAFQPSSTSWGPEGTLVLGAGAVPVEALLVSSADGITDLGAMIGVARGPAPSAARWSSGWRAVVATTTAPAQYQETVGTASVGPSGWGAFVPLAGSWGDQVAPAVAFDGAVGLMAWVEDDAAGPAVWARFVDVHGTPTGDLLPISGPHLGGSPASRVGVAAHGGRFLVAWDGDGLAGAFVEAGGGVGERLELSASRPRWHEVVASDQGFLLVTSDGVACSLELVDDLGEVVATSPPLPLCQAAAADGEVVLIAGGELLTRVDLDRGVVESWAWPGVLPTSLALSGSTLTAASDVGLQRVTLPSDRCWPIEEGWTSALPEGAASPDLAAHGDDVLLVHAARDPAFVSESEDPWRAWITAAAAR